MGSYHGERGRVWEPDEVEEGQNAPEGSAGHQQRHESRPEVVQDLPKPTSKKDAYTDPGVCVCVASVECEFGPCVYVRWESCVRACACVLQALQVKCTLRERSRREQRDK